MPRSLLCAIKTTCRVIPTVRTSLHRLLIIVFCSFGTFVTAGDQPNVVLIVADDLGYGDLGCYGGAIATPAIDALAAEGLLLKQFYANAPECTPTRAALLTGRYQHRIGGLECAIGVGNEGRYDEAKWLSDRHRLGLPITVPTLPSMLSAAGYRCGCVGKWHLGYDEPFHPMNHGFDSYFGPLGGGVDYFFHTEPRGEFLGTILPGERLFQKNRTSIDVSGEYLTDVLTERSVEWIKQQSAEHPFFLYLPYTAPHSPYQGRGDNGSESMSATAWNQGSKETYAAMVSALDDGVMRVVDVVDSKGFSENTLVVFLSDNGPTKYGSAGKLRGNKGNVFEGGIRVPCVVRYPQALAAGEVSEQVGMTMDLAASILALAGVAPERHLDGIDLLAEIANGDAIVDRTLFWRIRRGARTRKAVRVGDWKYVHLQDDGHVETALFDLATDPGEKADRSMDAAAHLLECREAFFQMEEETKPPRIIE